MSTSDRLTIVAILTIRAGAETAFRDFERRAATIMARHRGALERAIAIPAHGEEPAREVHVVTFPDAASFAAYRADPDLVALADLRASAIAHTDVLIGHDLPP